MKNMIRFLVFFLVCFLLCQNAFAFTLKGRFTDKSSGKYKLLNGEYVQIHINPLLYSPSQPVPKSIGTASFSGYYQVDIPDQGVYLLKAIWNSQLFAEEVNGQNLAPNKTAFLNVTFGLTQEVIDENIDPVLLPILKETINQFKVAYGLPSSATLTKTDAKILFYLQTTPDKNLPGIKGLEYCTSLKTLNLALNQISDLSPLSNLKYLTDLSLFMNKITDITPLAKLKNTLKELSLHDNQISDITPLAECKNLTHLTLNKNKISNINALANLTSLVNLSLSENPISDITPLINNPGLGKDMNGVKDKVWLVGNDQIPAWQIASLEAKGVDVIF